MQEALRIAHEADKAEEEEFMRKAIEESKALEDQSKSKAQAEADEEAEMIRQAIEMSRIEEEERKK